MTTHWASAGATEGQERPRKRKTGGDFFANTPRGRGRGAAGGGGGGGSAGYVSPWRRQLYGRPSPSKPSSPTLTSPKTTSKASSAKLSSSTSSIPRSTTPPVSSSRGAVRSVALAFSGEGSNAVAAFLARQPIRTPWDSQVQAEVFMANRALGRSNPPEVRGGLYCDAMRMGKCGACILYMLHAIQQRVARGQARFGLPFLVVGPSDVMGVWVDEVKATLGPDVLSVERIDSDSAVAAHFSQQDTVRLLDRLRQQTDVIVTTYSTLSRTRSGVADMLVRDLEYATVFCDEAHLVNNEATMDFQAVLALRSPIKWYVTGTPIQNDVASLRAALRIVGVPDRVLAGLQGDALVKFARQLTLRRVPLADGHIEMGPALDFGGVEPPAEATPWVPRLRPIPVEALDFYSPIEKLMYDHLVRFALATGTRNQSAAFAAAEYEENADATGRGGMGLSFATTSLLQKTCLSPLTLLSAFYAGRVSVPDYVLVPPRHLFAVPPPIDDEEGEREEMQEDEKGGGEEEEDQDPMDVDVDEQRAYNERLVRLAVLEATYEAIGADPALALRDEADAAELRPALDHIRRHMLPPVSTKERWICRTLLTNTTDVTGEKVLIFSQWYKPLLHLARLLTLRVCVGLPHARAFVFVHGKVPTEQRERDRRRFLEDPQCGVMLSTLKTNTVGVDLTCANHVVLCDPSWNPMPEFQATSRVFGPKQTRPVSIYRLVIRDTIDGIIAARADGKVTLDGLLPMALQDEIRDMNAMLDKARKQVGEGS